LSACWIAWFIPGVSITKTTKKWFGKKQIENNRYCLTRMHHQTEATAVGDAVESRTGPGTNGAKAKRGFTLEIPNCPGGQWLLASQRGGVYC
jgi:hypothetical protein